MSATAARGAAGFLRVSGRLRGPHEKDVAAERARRQAEAEQAAEALRLEREAKLLKLKEE